MRLGWKLPLERLSATSLSTAIQCPEQFRQKYLLKKPEKLFGERFVGIVNHKTHELGFEYKMRTGTDFTLAQMKERYMQTWKDVLDDQGEPDWKDTDTVKAFQSGMDMVELYHEKVGVHVHPIAVEQRFEFDIPGIPSKIVGYLDVVETGKVRERKTSAQRVKKPKARWRFQGKLYQIAAGLPVQWDVVTRQVTPQLCLAEEFPDLYMPYTNPDPTIRIIRDTALRINDLYARHGADQPWPTTGIFGDWLCDYCTFGPRYESSCIQWGGSLDSLAA